MPNVTPSLQRTKKFEQPSTVWEFPHNLNANPHVTARIMYQGVLSQILPKSVEYPTPNLVRVTWSVPRTGELTIS